MPVDLASHASSPTLGAGWLYVDNSGEVIGPLQALTGAISAYNGENHTRLELRATQAAVVPEPATWLMWLGGMAVAWAVGRPAAPLRRRS